MKKKISVLLALVLALSLVLFGCGGDTGEGTTSGTDTVAGTNDIADGNDAVSDEGGTEPKEGYLDEATGIYHTFLYETGEEISFSMPEAWQIMDSFSIGGGICSIWPPEGVDPEEVNGVGIQYNSSGLSEEGAQAIYDSMNETGRLGESQEVTYGGNTYLTNVTPTADDGVSYFFYTEKSGPVVYISTGPNHDKAVLEEVLSTLVY